MINEIGTVVELKGRSHAMVLCQKSTLCENCASSGHCNLGDDDRSRLVEVHNVLGAKVGDRVKITTSTRSFLHSSFLIYVVPLIALVVGAVTGQFIGEVLESGLDTNLFSAIFGVFFMVGSFLVIRVGSLALNKEHYMPKITEIMDEKVNA